MELRAKSHSFATCYTIYARMNEIPLYNKYNYEKNIYAFIYPKAIHKCIIQNSNAIKRESSAKFRFVLVRLFSIGGRIISLPSSMAKTSSATI